MSLKNNGHLKTGRASDSKSSMQICVICGQSFEILKRKFADVKSSPRYFASFAPLRLAVVFIQHGVAKGAEIRRVWSG
jgi:hypothetical protein